MKSKKETRYIIQLQNKEKGNFVAANRALGSVSTKDASFGDLQHAIDHRKGIEYKIECSPFWGAARIIKRVTEVTESVVSEELIESLNEFEAFEIL